MAKKKNGKIGPRSVPERDDFYMGLAFWIASKSKDPSTQNGAVIVNDNVIIGTGYNGPPASYKDDELDWSRPHKYCHILHAEENAIDHCLMPLLLPGSTLYVTGRPCSPANNGGCMLRIARAKIKRVVYFPLVRDAGSMMEKDAEVGDDIVKRSGLAVEMYKGNLNWMRDRMEFMRELGIF